LAQKRIGYRGERFDLFGAYGGVQEKQEAGNQEADCGNDRHLLPEETNPAYVKHPHPRNTVILLKEGRPGKQFFLAELRQDGQDGREGRERQDERHRIRQEEQDEQDKDKYGSQDQERADRMNEIGFRQEEQVGQDPEIS
jgi:hypothetical protein